MCESKHQNTVLKELLKRYLFLLFMPLYSLFFPPLYKNAVLNI